MFGVGGEHDLTERTLPHLRGLARQPAGAGRQRRLEPAADRRLRRAARRRAPARRPARPRSTSDTRRFLVACADTAAERWRETDQGIWEVRGEPRHFLYSKVMCWVALDRAIALPTAAARADRVDGVDSDAATRSATTVLDDGWSDEAGAFTQYFGSTDAGRLQPDDGDRRLPAGRRPADARHASTRSPSGSPTTAAWSTATAPRSGVDGLAGEEGTFLLCTFWLAQALALAGQVDRARAVFERAVAFVNDVGLLAEEVDPPPASCSATSRRRSATSAWSTPPGRSAQAQRMAAR